VADAFSAAHRNSPLVRNRIIFAADSPERASDEAKELHHDGRDTGVRTGLEPIDVSSAESLRKRVGRDRLAAVTFEGRRS